jgi:uncharacterized RDD family membrane protein YckC
VTLAPERVHDIAARVHGVPPPPAEPRYIGLVTRAIAFALDAAIVNIIAAVVAGAAALILSVFPLGHNAKTVAVAVGGFLWFVWLIAYFTTFWATTGQTPGNRLMRIRVQRPDGRPLRPRRALLRVGAVTLAALPLFAGFVPVLLNDRRRSLADWLVDTVVVSSDEPQVVAGGAPTTPPAGVA